MTTQLIEYANWLNALTLGGADVAARDSLAALLRSAASQTVGTEWGRYDDPNRNAHNGDVIAGLESNLKETT